MHGLSRTNPVTLILLVLSGLGLGEPAQGQSGRTFETVPDSVLPSERFLIYLHGRIIETEGRRPTHPDFGVYEYDEILRVFSDAGLVVVSEARPPQTPVLGYAEKVVGEVQQLLRAGVPPGHITVMGFSKGGIIAIATASLLQNPNLNFVFLAACSGAVFDNPDFQVSGRILSVFEKTDVVGVSCQPLFDRSPGVRASSEVEISTGKRHGAFYRPLPDWVAPVLKWVRTEGSTSGPEREASCSSSQCIVNR